MDELCVYQYNILARDERVQSTADIIYYYDIYEVHTAGYYV